MNQSMKTCFIIIFLFSMSYLSAGMVKATVWDEYLKDLKDYRQVLGVFNLKNLTSADWKALKDRYKFTEEYRGTFLDPEENYEFSVPGNRATELYFDRIARILIKVRSVDDLKFLGLDSQMSYDDLVHKFGQQYQSNTRGTYYLVAEPRPGAPHDECYTIHIMLSSSDKIQAMMIIPFENEKCTHTSEFRPIKTGVIAGDCYNGKGFYQYADGMWVSGTFYKGDLQYGEPKYYFSKDYESELAYIKKAAMESAASAPVASEKAAVANEVDTSFWDDYLLEQKDWMALITLFNEKDFIFEERFALLQKYGFGLQHNTYYSKDGKISIEFSDDTVACIKNITFYIKTASDLSIFGLDKQMNITELRKLVGKEYHDYKSNLTVIHAVNNESNRDNFVPVVFSFDSTTGHISSVSFTPYEPKKIKFEGTLSPITTGPLSGDCNNGTGVYRWIDGWRFEGEFRNGMPYNGSVFTDIRHTTADFRIKNGVTSEGILPDAMVQARKERPPVLVKLDKAREEYDALLKSGDYATHWMKELLQKLPDKEETRDRIINHANNGIDSCRRIRGLLEGARDMLANSGKPYTSERQILDADIRTFYNIQHVFEALENMAVNYGRSTEEEQATLVKLESYVNSIRFDSVRQALATEDFGNK